MLSFACRMWGLELWNRELSRVRSQPPNTTGYGPQTESNQDWVSLIASHGPGFLTLAPGILWDITPGQDTVRGTGSSKTSWEFVLCLWRNSGMELTPLQGLFPLCSNLCTWP